MGSHEYPAHVVAERSAASRRLAGRRRLADPRADHPYAADGPRRSSAASLSGGSCPIAGRVRVDGVKWLLDGTPIERSAAQREPYADDPRSSGAMNFPESELRVILKEVRDRNTPLMVQTSGCELSMAMD